MNVSLIVTYDPAHISSCTESVKKLMDAVGVKPKFLNFPVIFFLNISTPSYNKIINFINNISCSKIKTNKLSRKTNLNSFWLSE